MELRRARAIQAPSPAGTRQPAEANVATGWRLPVLVLLGIVLALAARGQARGAPAQTPGPEDQLATQLLTADSFPGWRSIGTVKTTSNGLAIAENLFAPTNGDFGLIAIALIAQPSGGSLASLGPQLQDGSLLQTLASSSTQNTLTDFQLTNPQGVGQQDQSATFAGTVSGRALVYGSDLFLRDNELGLGLYAGDSSQIDPPTALQDAVSVANMQDAQLQSLLGAGTTAAPRITPIRSGSQGAAVTPAAFPSLGSARFAAGRNAWSAESDRSRQS